MQKILYCAHSRYCTNLGTCANIPHGLPPCTDEDADEKNCDESINNLGDARCSDDKHCRGERVCNAGLCRDAYPACDSGKERAVCNEKINKLGPSKCKKSLDCRL